MKTAAVFAIVAAAGVASAQIDNGYTENFESYTSGPGEHFEMGDAGWLVGANVFNPAGDTLLYGYFAFPAPHDGGAFSNVATGEGGPSQGAQQLVMFSDYNNGDHNIGNRIESNYFRDWIIGTGEAGEWNFSFDVKQGDIGGASTAEAFIKVIDQNNGFSETAIVTVDTTSTGTDWSRLDLTMDIDQAWEGQLFQIGFRNVASNFDPSGVFYDNIEVSFIPTPGAAAVLGLAGLASLRRRR